MADATIFYMGCDYDVRGDSPHVERARNALPAMPFPPRARVLTGGSTLLPCVWPQHTAVATRLSRLDRRHLDRRRHHRLLINVSHCTMYRMLTVMTRSCRCSHRMPCGARSPLAAQLCGARVHYEELEALALREGVWACRVLCHLLRNDPGRYLLTHIVVNILRRMVF